LTRSGRFYRTTPPPRKWIFNLVAVNKSRRKVDNSGSVPTGGRKSRRNVVVLASLLGSLTLTSALLLVLAPAPLNPDSRSLLAVGSADSLDLIFAPEVNPANRWRYIYIHHCKHPSADPNDLDTVAGGDHFLIGNGRGCQDGEIRVLSRWNLQQPASIPGVNIAPDSISVALVGDFDAEPPTPVQMQRLADLITSIQSRLHIPAGRVSARSLSGPAGIGGLFPAGDFSRRLLP
jgi:hypothetical protein